MTADGNGGTATGPAAGQGAGAATRPAQEPVALYRVTFRPTEGAPSDVLMRFDDCGPRVAVAESLLPRGEGSLPGAMPLPVFAEGHVGPHHALPPGGGRAWHPTPDPREGVFFFLFVSKAAPDAEQWARDGQAWMELDEPAGIGPALRVGMEGGYLLWRPGRVFAMVPAAPGQAGKPDGREEVLSLLSAVAEFAFYHGELCRLEAELAGQWDFLQQDMPLLHDVGRREAARSPQVEKMTASVLERRIRAARIERRLRRPLADLPAGAKQVGQKLRSLAKVDERMVRLDEQMQVFERSYATVNQGLSDYRHSRRSMVVIIVILVLLTIGVFLVLSDLYYVFHFGPE
jgi:hypothetical protein